jgi:hypothetical protein
MASSNMTHYGYYSNDSFGTKSTTSTTTGLSKQLLENIKKNASGLNALSQYTPPDTIHPTGWTVPGYRRLSGPPTFTQWSSR